jgi:hypothetical protein
MAQEAIDWSLSAAHRHQQRIARPQSQSLNRPNGLARHQRQGKMLDDGREHEPENSRKAAKIKKIKIINKSQNCLII